MNLERWNHRPPKSLLGSNQNKKKSTKLFWASNRVENYQQRQGIAEEVPEQVASDSIVISIRSLKAWTYKHTIWEKFISISLPRNFYVPPVWKSEAETVETAENHWTWRACERTGTIDTSEAIGTHEPFCHLGCIGAKNWNIMENKEIFLEHLSSKDVIYMLDI